MSNKRQLRIAMIAPPWLSIPPAGYGGIENVLAALIPALISLGTKVELFTVGDSAIQGVKKHWLYPTGQNKFIHRPQYDTLPVTVGHMLYALNAIEQDGNFDLIHSHNGYTALATLAFAGESKLPPVLHTMHELSFTTKDRLKLNIADSLPLWRQMGHNDRLYFVGISKALMRRAPRAIKPQILEPVHNGLDPSQFKFSAKKDDYFITLARFHPDKGHDIAIKVCQKAGQCLKMAGVVADLSRPKQIMMEIANPLSRYRSLIDFRYFSDKILPHLYDGLIEYHGNLNGSAKMRFISHAKALLFPIRWDEPFGMAVIEALACGTPVIAMARGAMPELISHGKNGFLAHNQREFEHYMKRIGDIDPEACRQSVEERFSATVMAGRYLDRYQTVLERSNRGRFRAWRP